MKTAEIFVLFVILIFVGLVCCAASYNLGKDTERKIFLRTLKDRDLIEYVLDDKFQVQWEFKNEKD